MKNKYKLLIKDTIIFAIGSIGSKMILFLLVPIYTNFLSTKEYGIADLIFTLSQLLIPFVSLTIYNGILRFGLSKNEKKKDVLYNSMIVTIIGCILMTIITPIFSFYTVISRWKWYLCSYVIISCFNLVGLNYLKINEKNKVYAISCIIQTVILALVNIITLTIFKLGIKGYLISNIISILFSTILIFAYINIFKELKDGKYNKKLLLEMICFSAPIIINDISWWVIHSSDKIMIEIMIGAGILGIYTVATKIPSLINVIISIFSQAWGISSIKEIETTNDIKFYSNVFNVYSFIVFGVATFVITIIKPFMRIFVGNNFYDAWKLIPLLIVSASFAAFAAYFGSLYSALKKNINTMITTVLAAIINVLLNYIFIQKVGIWGAIIGTLSAYFFVSFVRLFDILRYIKIKVLWKSFIANIILLLSLAILASMDYKYYIVSIISILVFVIINKNYIVDFFKLIIKKRGDKSDT